MERTTRVSSWDKIQRGVKETERLMGQKQYNLSMMKARQTLEYMVRCLGDLAGITDSDLSTTIDELALNKWISKTTCEHYHAIRELGNKAIHEGNENAYDCNQAYHLLSQEVYTFANDYNTRKRTSSPSSQSRNRSRRRQRRMPIMPVVTIICLVIVIIFVVKLFSPNKDDDEVTTTPTTTLETVEQPTTVPTTETETMAPTTPAPVYKVSSLTNGLNVRSEPSTTGSILGVLDPGTIIEFVKEHNDEWAIIKYNGEEGYVASQYLEHD